MCITLPQRSVTLLDHNVRSGLEVPASAVHVEELSALKSLDFLKYILCEYCQVVNIL